MAANGEKIPITFQLDGKLIDGAIVKPLTFSGFIECLIEAQTMREPKLYEARIRRARMAHQVTYYTNGAIASVSMLDALKLPIPAVHSISSQLDEGEGVAGKIVRPGDGIDQAITYELGTPIPVQGKEPIKELEFLAKTYGDIEDVLAAPDSIQQAGLLISTVAKPLGTSLTLLPSWATKLITVADGVTISRTVLPHFLGQPEML
jgi:hypothetical protein